MPFKATRKAIHHLQRKYHSGISYNQATKLPGFVESRHPVRKFPILPLADKRLHTGQKAIISPPPLRPGNTNTALDAYPTMEYDYQVRFAHDELHTHLTREGFIHRLQDRLPGWVVTRWDPHDTAMWITSPHGEDFYARITLEQDQFVLREIVNNTAMEGGMLAHRGRRKTPSYGSGKEFVDTLMSMAHEARMDFWVTDIQNPRFFKKFPALQHMDEYNIGHSYNAKAPWKLE